MSCLQVSLVIFFYFHPLRLFPDFASSFLPYSFFFFFFSSRRRHTRFKCDWSSDVCSSDLVSLVDTLEPATMAASGRRGLARALVMASISADSRGPAQAMGANWAMP